MELTGIIPAAERRPEEFLPALMADMLTVIR